MADALTLGFSPCPNDTFIFYALVHGKIPGAPVFTEVLEDIATLNRMALQGALDATKISFHAFAHMRDRYCLLHSGGALGRGCGPLIVARDEFAPGDLAQKTIAVPGKFTTAALLLQLFAPEVKELRIMPFHEIMEKVQQGEVDAGIIIHESRFTYPKYGLREVVDLGKWWEETTGHPLPLGGILALRELGADLIGRIDRALRASVEYAHRRPDQVRGYVRDHAQEMEDDVMEAHIQLYVNAYTLDYEPDGEAAIEDLLARAEAAGIVERSARPIFVDR
jgi:1,4-dihydroxy-6-naphthoate synthase